METDFRFTSATGQGACQAWLFAPDAPNTADQSNPRLILIVHGMAEHASRYQRLAQTLTKQGYWVGMYDQAGHGLTAPDTAHLGFFGASDGVDHLVDDVLAMRDQCFRRLTQTIQAEPQIVLIGHSMGSFIVREVITRAALQADAVVLSGTAGPSLSIGPARWLAERSIRRHGPQYLDLRIEQLMARSMRRGLRDQATPFDWLTRDEAIVAAYVADPLCGFPLTAAGYRDLFSLMLRINRSDWPQRIHGQAPVLLISGDRDPVGDFGRGPRHVWRQLLNQQIQAKLNLYAGGRHESFNEINREEVIADMLRWLTEVLPG